MWLISKMLLKREKSRHSILSSWNGRTEYPTAVGAVVNHCTENQVHLDLLWQVLIRSNYRHSYNNILDRRLVVTQWVHQCTPVQLKIMCGIICRIFLPFLCIWGWNNLIGMCEFCGCVPLVNWLDNKRLVPLRDHLVSNFVQILFNL